MNFMNIKTVTITLVLTLVEHVSTVAIINLVV